MAWLEPGAGDPVVRRNFETIGEFVIVGLGDPEGKVPARLSAHFHRQDGAPGTFFYVKMSDDNQPTGWVAVA